MTCANCHDPACVGPYGAYSANTIDRTLKELDRQLTANLASFRCERRAKERALAEVERLRAELADARKPFWVPYVRDQSAGWTLFVGRKAMAHVIRLRGAGWVWGDGEAISQSGSEYRRGRDGSADAAMRDAAKACGVEVAP